MHSLTNLLTLISSTTSIIRWFHETSEGTFENMGLIFKTTDYFLNELEIRRSIIWNSDFNMKNQILSALETFSSVFLLWSEKYRYEIQNFESGTENFQNISIDALIGRLNRWLGEFRQLK